MSCFALLRGRCRLLAGSLGAAMLLPLALFAPLSHADEQRDALPRDFSVGACHQMVQHEGRMIAWARWEQGFSLQKVRAVKFDESSPPWFVELVQTWIGDAYSWRVSDANVRNWAEELGNTDKLPSASELTPHEMIAIWLRRIAQDCESRKGEASAAAPAVGEAATPQ